MEDGDVGAITPDTYRTKHGSKIAFSMIIFKQLQNCMYWGTMASTDKESLRKFERSVKMLEAFLSSFMDKTHRELVNKSIKKAQDSMASANMLGYYESIRLRFMYLMKVLNKIQDILPEEKAIERIGFEKEVLGED